MLFVVQLIMLTWIAFISFRRCRHVVLWCLWFVGFAVGGATLAGVFHLLLVAQAIMRVGFAALTFAATSEILAQLAP